MIRNAYQGSFRALRVLSGKRPAHHAVPSTRATLSPDNSRSPPRRGKRRRRRRRRGQYDDGENDNDDDAGDGAAESAPVTCLEPLVIASIATVRIWASFNPEPQPPFEQTLHPLPA